MDNTKTLTFGLTQEGFPVVRLKKGKEDLEFIFDSHHDAIELGLKLSEYGFLSKLINERISGSHKQKIDAFSESIFHKILNDTKFSKQVEDQLERNKENGCPVTNEKKNIDDVNNGNSEVY